MQIILSTIKEKIENIKRNEDKNDGENNEDKNNEMLNNNNKLYNMPTMDKIRIYKCLNCNNSYVSNECFNKEKNKLFEKHNFQIDENNNINLIEDYFNDKENENKNKDNQKDNAFKNINIIIDEDEDNKKEGKINYGKEDDDITNFNMENGSLKKQNPYNNELEQIGNFYKYLIVKNMEIDIIKEYLENYIQFGVRPEMEKLKDYEKKQVNNRICRVRNLINDLKPNTNKKNYNN